MSLMDMRGAKFNISMTPTPEKQKLLEDKLNEAMKARGLTPHGPMRPETKVLTLDEALAYFQELKKIQDLIEAREREENSVER